jgi:hypothetical protein
MAAWSGSTASRKGPKAVQQNGWACVHVNGVLRVIPVTRTIRSGKVSYPLGVNVKHPDYWFTKPSFANRFMQWRKSWLKTTSRWGKTS